MEKETVYWHLPEFYYFGLVHHILIDAMKRFPEKFRDGHKIGSIYGSFPGAIWNGGRNIIEGFSPRKDVEKIVKSYNAEGIPVRFTWTNMLLEEKHVYDTYCNMIMEVSNNGLNQVLVNRPVLEEYIRKNYPDYPILSSTTKRILNVDRLLDEVSKDYFLVVLDYDLNHNEEVIEKLLPVADRIEILVDETCQPNCPDRMRHYMEISKHTLAFDGRIDFPCMDPHQRKSFQDTMKNPSFMTNEDIDAYIEKGFRNFKLVGRGGTPEFLIDSIIYYLVKDEHKDFMRRYYAETINRMRNARPVRK